MLGFISTYISLNLYLYTCELVYMHGFEKWIYHPLTALKDRFLPSDL